MLCLMFITIQKLKLSLIAGTSHLNLFQNFSRLLLIINEIPNNITLPVQTNYFIEKYITSVSQFNDYVNISNRQIQMVDEWNTLTNNKRKLMNEVVESKKKRKIANAAGLPSDIQQTIPHTPFYVHPFISTNMEQAPLHSEPVIFAIYNIYIHDNVFFIFLIVLLFLFLSFFNSLFYFINIVFEQNETYKRYGYFLAPTLVPADVTTPLFTIYKQIQKKKITVAPTNISGKSTMYDLEELLPFYYKEENEKQKFMNDLSKQFHGYMKDKYMMNGPIYDKKKTRLLKMKIIIRKAQQTIQQPSHFDSNDNTRFGMITAITKNCPSTLLATIYYTDLPNNPIRYHNQDLAFCFDPIYLQNIILQAGQSIVFPHGALHAGPANNGLEDTAVLYTEWGQSMQRDEDFSVYSWMWFYAVFGPTHPRFREHLLSVVHHDPLSFMTDAQKQIIKKEMKAVIEQF